MRVLTRSELRLILNALPLASKHDSPDRSQVKIPAISTPQGEILPGAILNFVKIEGKNEKGTIKWAWVYTGPLPYLDEEIIIEKKDKIDLQDTPETKKILLP